jgi:hypothetical protein
MTPEERNTLGNNGRDYVLKNHNYETLAANFLSVLSS